MEITPAIRSEFLSFDAEQTVSEMIGQLRKYEERHGLVFKKDKFLGTIEKKRLLRSRFDTSKAKVGNYIHRVPLVNEHADVIETAYTLFQADSDFVPVESNKKIIGVLSAFDVVKLAAELPETKAFTVADVKLVKGEKLDKEDPISKAAELMYKARVDQVPVFEGKNLYGIVSFRDLLQKYLNWSPNKEFSMKFQKESGGSKGSEANKPNLALLPVKSFSTNQNIVTCSRRAMLSEAVNAMVKNNVSSVLIMDGTKFEGLLTLKNILRFLGSMKIPENFNIRFVGLNDVGLLAHQKDAVQNGWDARPSKKATLQFAFEVVKTGSPEPGIAELFFIEKREWADPDPSIRKERIYFARAPVYKDSARACEDAPIARFRH